MATHLRVLFALLFSVSPLCADSIDFAPLTPSNEAYIAILIDDMGDNRVLGERALNLPADISFAFLPHTPHVFELANKAHTLGRDVLLHAPMESESHLGLMGKGALTTKMDEVSLREQLNDNLASVPFVKGFNNHMGSVFTRDRERMLWLLQEAQNQRLFFVDSRTTADSVALPQARALGVPSFGRDIFLDHEESFAAAEKQFFKLVQLAKKRGYALAIGHPKKNTLAVLEKHLPQLASNSVAVVPVSKLTSGHWRQLHAVHSTDSTQSALVAEGGKPTDFASAKREFNSPSKPSTQSQGKAVLSLALMADESIAKARNKDELAKDDKATLVLKKECPWPHADTAQNIWLTGQQLLHCMSQAN